MAYSDAIKRIRTSRRMTQEQLALAAGMPGQSRIGNYEKGTREPSLADAAAMAAALGVTTAEILDLDYPDSQSMRPNPGKLADLIETVDAGVAGTRFASDSKTKARLVVALFMDAKVETASRETVTALLSGILASMEHLK